MNITPEEQKKLQRLADVLDNGVVGISNQLNELEDKIDAALPSVAREIASFVDEKVDSIPPVSFPDVQRVEVVNPSEAIDLSTVETYLEGILAKNIELPEPVDNSRLEAIMRDVLVTCRMTVEELQKEKKPVDFSQIVAAIKETSQTGFDTEDFFERLNQSLSKKLDVRLMGGPSRLPMSSSVDSIGTNILAGTGTNGTRDLTVANTWYAVPSTVPTTPYQLVVTIENAVGTIRWGYSNSGTPSSTNGNIAPSQLTVNLGGSQTIYYASSTAGDDVNWTTKTF